MKIISQDKNEQKLAKIPHEIFTINAALIHLFLATAMLKFGDPKFAINLPIMISVCIIIWTYFRNKKAQKYDCDLVKIHWQISLKRYKSLIFVYIFYFLINYIVILAIGDTATGINGDNLMQNVFLILSVVPLFVVVFLSVLLGSGSMFNAGRGEVPIKLLKNINS